MKYIDDDIQYRRYRKKAIDKKLFNQSHISSNTTFSVQDMPLLNFNRFSSLDRHTSLRNENIPKYAKVNNNGNYIIYVKT
jgi:hypothetical protein